MEGVERIDGELYENRARSSRLGNGQGLPDRRHDLPNSSDGGTELTQWLEERHLVDVLQGPSALYVNTVDGELKLRTVKVQYNTLKFDYTPSPTEADSTAPNSNYLMLVYSTCTFTSYLHQHLTPLHLK